MKLLNFFLLNFLKTFNPEFPMSISKLRLRLLSVLEWYTTQTLFVVTFQLAHFNEIYIQFSGTSNPRVLERLSPSVWTRTVHLRSYAWCYISAGSPWTDTFRCSVHFSTVASSHRGFCIVTFSCRGRFLLQLLWYSGDGCMLWWLVAPLLNKSTTYFIYRYAPLGLFCTRVGPQRYLLRHMCRHLKTPLLARYKFSILFSNHAFIDPYSWVEMVDSGPL